MDVDCISATATPSATDLNLKVNLDLLKSKLLQSCEKILPKSPIKKAQQNHHTYTYENLSDTFTKEYSSANYIQYSFTYSKRLMEIKKDVVAQAKVKWKNVKLCEHILDLKGKEEQIIIGVIYKEMPLKPSILKGMESILGSKKVENFVNETEDYLVIEDNSGRVRISNKSPLINFSPSNYVSGIVTGLKGRLDEKGLFLIEDIEFYHPYYAVPTELLQSISNEQSNNFYNMMNSTNEIIAFVSGLQFGYPDNSGKSALALNLLVDLFQERLLTDINLSNMISRITRVVIAGNSVYSPEDTDLVERGSFAKQELNSRIYKSLIKNYEEFDHFLCVLSHYLRVDVMPGPDDNSSSFFPVVEINPILLPECQQTLNQSLLLVPNPYRFSLAKKDKKVCLLGTSGQNIQSIRKYSNIRDPIEAMEKTLDWAHLSPCAPDTLRSYPFSEKDPLALKEMPNVYFTGNQTEFATSLYFYNGYPIRLLSIPIFTKKYSITLIDVETLEVCEYKLRMD